MATNEAIIWQFLKSQGFTDAGAAGLMGNLYAESALNPKNLQNTYEKKLGLSDEEYTRQVDNGQYTNFVRDSAGYGLAQWTYWSRKEKLLKYAQLNKKSIGDLHMQLEFLISELSNYSKLWELLHTTDSVLIASNTVLFDFERPANQGEEVQTKRASYGQVYFDRYKEPPKITSLVSPNQMKYNENNKPLICMQTNSTCYKGTRKMVPVGILWHSTGANNPNLKRYVQPLKTDANYTEIISLLGQNTSGTDWNHTEIQAGLNAWIGKLANGTVTSIQSMPWDYRPWGCGSGKKGSCNSGWIQFEICEDDLNNADYFNKTYEEAVQLTAYLCKMYNLDPKGTVDFNGVKVPVILCHADAYKLGLGSNHADVLHWFKKYGKTMDDVRNDVSKVLSSINPTEEEEEMTQEQFNTMMNTWIAEQAKKEPGTWSKDARDWGEKNGLITGDDAGSKMYKKFITREEFITVLYRALHRMFID